MFQAPPPPPPPPAPEVLRTEGVNLAIATDDRLVVFAKGQQAERGVVRYQLFQRVDVEATRPAAAPDASPDAAPPPILCTWTVSVWLQRDPCIESITGRLACMQPYTVRLDDRDRGSEPVPEAAACVPEHPSVSAAMTRMSEAVSGGAAARFEADLERRFAPELGHAGVAVRPRVR